jgi:hypothetical protein
MTGQQASVEGGPANSIEILARLIVLIAAVAVTILTAGDQVKQAGGLLPHLAADGVHLKAGFRIRIPGLEPDSDPGIGTGSGSRRAKMTHKRRKKLRNF